MQRADSPENLNLSGNLRERLVELGIPFYNLIGSDNVYKSPRSTLWANDFPSTFKTEITGAQTRAELNDCRLKYTERKRIERGTVYTPIRPTNTALKGNY